MIHSPNRLYSSVAWPKYFRESIIKGIWISAAPSSASEQIFDI